MMNSMTEMIQAKKKAPESASAAETTEVIESQAENATADDNVDDAPEPSLSSELTEKLLGKNNSIEAKLEEAKLKREEQERLLAEQADEEQEEEEQAEDTPQAIAIEIDGQKLESAEAIQEHIQTITAKTQELETAVSEYKQNEAKLIEILDAVPEFGGIISSLATGDTLRVALIKAGFGPEDFTIESESEEDAEALVQAKLERKRAIEEQRKIQKQFEANSTKSEKVLEEYKSKNNLDDKTGEKIVQAMADFVKNAMDGVLTENALDLFRKAVVFENAVQKAESQGQIKGRNEKIVIERQKRNGDGIPALAGRAPMNDTAKKPSKLGGLIRQSPTSFTQLIKK
jgi:hypothetical protein